MSTLFRRPALRLLPRVTGTRRRRPTKVRRRQATSPPEVPPAVRRQLAVRFGFRTRRMSEQAIGATSRLRGAIGAITSFRQVTTAVPGRGQIVVSPCRKPLAPSPHRRDGRRLRVVRAFRRHRREVSGRQGKGAHVFVPRPRAMQVTGALVGDPPRMIAVASRRDNDVGARTQPTSSRR